MASKRQHDIKALVGNEPDCSKLDPKAENYISSFMHYTNWYSYEKTRKDSYRYHADFVKKNRSSDYKLFVDYVPESAIHLTMGWMLRMKIRNAKFSDDHEHRLELYLNNLIETARVKEKKTPIAAPVAETRQVISIQDAMKEKISEYIGELEVELDEFYKNDKELNLYNHMKARHLPAAYIPEIEIWAKIRLDQFTEVVEGKDAQLNEGYSNFDKKKLKSIVKMFSSFIEDCEKYSQYKKANKKPRAVREKSPSQQVKSVKYKIKDEELNLTSVSPTEMVGASQVWLFNTKTRKLSHYTTDSTKGMQVKGTSLQNWDPEKSKQKTLRNPNEQIKDLINAGKIKMRTFLKEIKAKEQNVNGRINIDTIILKAIK